nr:trem-like transcript 2 protein [Peromyscus maniculatus bairdii]
MEPWPLMLLLLLCLQGCVSGPSIENVYRKVQRREGESLSVQCSYKNRRNRVESKAWCKVKKKKCELNFIRGWVKGPSYSIRDDAKAKVVYITMEALRVQDSGRYWCMRNTAGNLYPLVGFQLEVYPVERKKSPANDHVAQWEKMIGAKPDDLSSISGPRSQETYLTAVVVVPTLLLVSVVFVMGYGFWKKRHMGSYNLGSDSAKPWKHLPEGPETLWKPAWSKITQ